MNKSDQSKRSLKPSVSSKAGNGKPRRPGRPCQLATGGRGKATGTDQRAALLDAAVSQFARHGVAATSLQAVAREAGVTPALLHYYFGNREQLLDVVFAERVLPLLARVLQGVAATGIDDPRALVRTVVPVVMTTVSDHPWLPPLWVREILTDGGALRERMLKNARLVAPLLRERFSAAQRSGQINPDVDPRLLVVSIIGLTLFPLAAAPIWRQVFDAGDISTETLVQHTLALLERGALVGAGVVAAQGAGQVRSDSTGKADVTVRAEGKKRGAPEKGGKS
jgi:TetR/AcrR family transcriptional regulator